MLTKEQEKRVQLVIGDRSDFPILTDDPRVNHMVDQLLDDSLPNWEDLAEAERDFYVEEALAQCNKLSINVSAIHSMFG